MHDGDELGPADARRRPLPPASSGDHLAPRHLEPVHDGPAALGDLGHAAAEDAVDADDRLVARLEQVDEAASMPALPVPDTASVISFSVWKTAAASAGSRP